MEVCVNQVLTPGSDTAGSEEAAEALIVFVKNVRALISRRRVNSWTVPPGMAVLHALPVHIMHFLGNVCKNVKSLKTSWHILVLRWSEKCRRRLYRMDVGTLLAVDMSA